MLRIRIPTDFRGYSDAFIGNSFHQSNPWEAPPWGTTPIRKGADVLHDQDTDGVIVEPRVYILNTEAKGAPVGIN